MQSLLDRTILALMQEKSHYAKYCVFVKKWIIKIDTFKQPHLFPDHELYIQYIAGWLDTNRYSIRRGTKIQHTGLLLD